MPWSDADNNCRATYPLRYDRLFKSFPAFLRETAAALDSREKPAPKEPQPPRRAGSVAKI